MMARSKSLTMRTRFGICSESKMRQHSSQLRLTNHHRWSLRLKAITTSNRYGFYWRDTLYFMTIIIMAQAQRRDFQLREYWKYELPKWCVLTWPMNKKVPCASCSKEEPFGMMFTSMAIHNHIWLWYPVCHECYKLELEARELADN